VKSQAAFFVSRSPIKSTPYGVSSVFKFCRFTVSVRFCVGFRVGLCRISINLTDTNYAGLNTTSRYFEEPASMTKRINRGRLPIPDSRGYVRPEVGGQRFIVGNFKEVGTSEMERRLSISLISVTRKNWNGSVARSATFTIVAAANG
jgi:hypothetical protein